MRRALAVAALLAACALPQERGPRSDGLLRQMRSCLADPDQRPCTLVEASRGFVVIKDRDRTKPYAWLLVPSTDVTGIEDPAVFEAPVAGFWQIGWQVGRRLVPAPPEGLGLAINSVAGRSQNLLHIHVSCVAARGCAPRWRARPSARTGRPSRSSRSRASASTPARVDRLEPSPFLLLRDLPGAAEDMGGQSLAVIGAADGGYFLVTDSTEPGVAAETEALLDETCGA